MSYVRLKGLLDRFGDEIADLVDLPDMAYDTDAEGQIVDQDGNALASQSGAAAINAAARDASAEIDGVIALGYDLPLPAGSTWPILESAAADLARLRLYDEAAPEHVLARAKRARELLEAIAEGTIFLVNADGERRERRASARSVDRGREFDTAATGSDDLKGLDNF